MADRYWVGGTATWDTTAGTKWASTSGGAGGASVPDFNDEVIFDAASGVVTITVGATAQPVGSFDSTTFTGTIDDQGGISTAGSGGNMIFGSGITYIGGGVFMGAPGTLTTNGNVFSSFGFGGTGTIDLADDLTITGLCVKQNSGTLNTNGFSIISSSMFLSAGTLNLGSTTWTINNPDAIPWRVTSSGTTLNAGTSTIKYTGTPANPIRFVGGNKTYNNVWFDLGSNTADISIENSNTFNNLKNTGTAAHTMKFTVSTTQTFASFTVSGSAGNLITITSSTTGTHDLVKTGGGVVSSDYLNIQHSVATPSSTWYAGANSTDNQAVATAGSGWIFTAPPAGNQNSGAFFQFM